MKRRDSSTVRGGLVSHDRHGGKDDSILMKTVTMETFQCSIKSITLERISLPGMKAEPTVGLQENMKTKFYKEKEAHKWLCQIEIAISFLKSWPEKIALCEY